MSKNGEIGLKLFLKIVGAILLMIGLIHFMSAMTIDRIIEYKEIEYSSPKISSDLTGYTIAFVTDTHGISSDELRGVVQKLDERKIDLLLLGGDYPSEDAAWRTMEILGQTRTRDGIYGVEGNHDDYENIFEAMRRYRIRPLSNTGNYLRENLFIAGVHDLWNRKPDVAKAIDRAKDRDFILLLAHNPDTTMQQDMSKVNLTLSGHTHGGQITFFGLWAPALHPSNGITRYDQKFKTGWTQSKDNTDVYVSNGTGTPERIPRVFARPQVIIITLKSKS